MLRTIFAGCFSLWAVAAHAGDWTEFRGPTGQGLSEATGLPTEWSDTKNVAWKKSLPGKGWSSPILLGERVYLTTAVPGEDDLQSLRALCLDAKTGDVEWNTEVFANVEGRAHRKNSYASPTPATDGQKLYVHFGTDGTACLDLQGTVLWRNRELKYAPVHGGGGSPILVDGKLVVSCDGSDVQFVAALDTNSGKTVWKTPRPENPSKTFAFSTPLVIEVDGRKQVVSAGAGAVVAYDPADGREIWQVKYPGGYSVVPRPVFGHGLVMLSTGFDTPAILAIRPDGTGDVTDSHIAWKFTRGAPRNASPLLVGDELYIVADNGVATCLNAKTGAEIWQQRLPGEYSASPVYADGKVYFQNELGDGLVIEAGKTFKELGRNPLGEQTLASYAVADRALFIRTESNLYRIEGK